VGICVGSRRRGRALRNIALTRAAGFGSPAFRYERQTDCDLRVEMLRVSGNGAQGLRCRPDRMLVHHGLVLNAMTSICGRHGEHDVKYGTSSSSA